MRRDGIAYLGASWRCDATESPARCDQTLQVEFQPGHFGRVTQHGQRAPLTELLESKRGALFNLLDDLAEGLFPGEAAAHGKDQLGAIPKRVGVGSEGLGVGVLE